MAEQTGVYPSSDFCRLFSKKRQKKCDILLTVFGKIPIAQKNQKESPTVNDTTGEIHLKIQNVSLLPFTRFRPRSAFILFIDFRTAECKLRRIFRPGVIDVKRIARVPADVIFVARRTFDFQIAEHNCIGFIRNGSSGFINGKTIHVFIVTRLFAFHLVYASAPCAVFGHKTQYRAQDAIAKRRVQGGYLLLYALEPKFMLFLRSETISSACKTKILRKPDEPILIHIATPPNALPRVNILHPFDILFFK